MMEALQIKLDEKGLIDVERWCVDDRSVRAARAAAGANKKVAIDTATSRKTTLPVDPAIDARMIDSAYA